MTRWATVPLEECIASIRAGVSLPGDDRIPENGEAGILALGAVSRGRFEASACKAVPAIGTRNLGPSVKAGTLLMSRSNTIDLVGATVYVAEDHPDRFLPDLLWEITLHVGSPVTPVFLADFLGTTAGRRLIQSAAMGTSGSMKKLSMERLRALEVPAIPAELQRTWERIRQHSDSTVVALDAVVLAKRKLKRGLMQELLTGRRRFPAYVGGPWRQVTVGELIECIEAGVSVRSHDAPARSNELGVLKTSALSGGRFQPHQNKRIIAEDVGRARVNPQAGCTIVSRMNTQALVGESAFVPEDHPSLFIPDRLWQIHPRRDVADPLWLSMALTSPSVRSRLGAMASGTSGSMKNISQDQLRSVKLDLPPLPEQHRIAATLALINSEIELLEAQREQYEMQKRGLMQKLLTGELEIPDDLEA